MIRSSDILEPTTVWSTMWSPKLWCAQKVIWLAVTVNPCEPHAQLPVVNQLCSYDKLSNTCAMISSRLVVATDTAVHNLLLWLRRRFCVYNRCVCEQRWHLLLYWLDSWLLVYVVACMVSVLLQFWCKGLAELHIAVSRCLHLLYKTVIHKCRNFFEIM